jgi:hypothetical protein
VKQNDLGEYEENNKRRAKDTSIQDKKPTPPQTNAKHKLSLKPGHVDGKHQVLNSRG